MDSVKLNGYSIDFYSEQEWIGAPLDILSWSGGLSMLEKLKRLSSEYAGLCTEIPEHLAKAMVDTYQDGINWQRYWEINGYKNYSNSDNDYWLTAKESFNSLSKLPYCIITKQS